MTALPPMTAFAQGMYDWLEPIRTGDDAKDYVLAVICGGYGEMFRDVEELVRAQPGRQPWQQAFDIDACPDFQIPWLGQLVGVSVVTGVPAAAQRAQVKAEAGFWRGTVTGLLGAVIQTLTGGLRAHLTERSSDAWTMLLTTDTRDTPSPTLTNNAAQAAKAAALLLTVSQTTVPLIDEGTRTIDASAGVINTATLADIT
jgi:hypothetical protein